MVSMFTWDEDKRRANLDKHGIDFTDAEQILDGYTATAEDLRETYGEHTVSNGSSHWGYCTGKSFPLPIPHVRMTITSSRSGRPRNMKHVSTSRKSKTDIKRLKSMKESDIVIDNDAPAWTPEMFARAIVRKGLKPVARKSLLSLRIDSDVLEWFRAKGRGYQSRMNALLRAYMEAHK